MLKYNNINTRGLFAYQLFVLILGKAPLKFNFWRRATYIKIENI